MLPELRPAFLAHGAASANLERLFAPGSLAVTTGQQPGLLTGPLYTIYKALSAAALAAALEARLGRPVIPVFWVAGDDHDFAEGNHCYILNQGNDVERLSLRDRDPTAALVPLYREPVGAEIDRVLEQLASATPSTEFRADALNWLARHYRAEHDLSTAFAQALGELLGSYGVVVFQPAHRAAKTAMAPWLLAALERATELDLALADRAHHLKESGRPVPIAVGEGVSAVMVEGALGRDRLVMNGAGFVTRRSGEPWSLRDLAALAKEQPERLSPNVLARPAMEAALLPTIAYVGGPGELAYLPQAAPVYRLLGVRPQVPVARWSGLAIEPRIAKVLEKYHLEPQHLNQPEGQLEAALVQSDIPPAASQAIATLRRTVEDEYERLGHAAAEVDPTLRKPVQSAKNQALASLTDVQKRLVSHLKQQNDVLVSQLAKARHNLFPLGQPQERMLTVAPFLVRYGAAFLQDAWEACRGYARNLAAEAGEP
ncbi:MAG TPA: bacillithiol biosynthesis cysteine-adding enzyme BshC [Gemmatimonadales bacterium]|nr:bacillithiol biosynthesis cysteine-adding enzyme BshC [Gemmatimonadales bacterium]